MDETYDCIVIGSGINALVCAARLARKGRSVCVLERNDRLGGCIRTDEITLPGFVHEVLSCWYPLFATSPAWAELGEELAALGIELVNTDVPTGVALPDGRGFVLRRSRAANVEAFEAQAAGDGEAYRRSLAQLEDGLELTFALFGGRLWSAATARLLLRELWRRGPHGLAACGGFALQSARAWLEGAFRGELARALLAPWVLHAGLGPDAASSGHMARVMAFTLEAAGCPVVRGGGRRLVDAFRRLIERHGGVLRTGAEVEAIVVRAGRARGVRVAGSELAARRAVVASVTPAQLYTRLLPAGAVPGAVVDQARAYRHGRACMQIHLALDAPPRWRCPALGGAALVHVTGGLDAVSRAVTEADCGLLPREGTIAVGQPAVLDPQRVPQGKGLLWLQLLELPSVIRGDAAGEIEAPADGRWTEDIRERYADRILQRLAGQITNLDGNVLARRVCSPADLEALNVNLAGGDPYGGACTLDQSFLWRPLPAVKNYATAVRGLYHIGASTHPGPGLGGVSGYLAAGEILR